MWSGMDAKTTEGKSLGYVSDAEYDEKTGEVTRFFTADGGMARALIGSFVITPDMVRGYRDGFMIVDARDKNVSLDGGLAGAAGEGYARRQGRYSEIARKVGAAAGEAVDKGSFALGRALGKAKRAIADAAAPEDEPPAVRRCPPPTSAWRSPRSASPRRAPAPRPPRSRSPRPTRPRRSPPPAPRSRRPRRSRPPRRATRSPAPPADSSAALARCSAPSRTSSTRQQVARQTR